MREEEGKMKKEGEFSGKEPLKRQRKRDFEKIG
jgi:hypothetical protein